MTNGIFSVSGERLVLLALALFTLALASEAAVPPPPSEAAVVSPLQLPAGWTVGDVHVHAAGDSGLDSHLQCKETQNKEECAERLVRNTFERAKDNGAQWIILTEHVPWLGINLRYFQACGEIKALLPVGFTAREVTLVKACQSVPIPVHDANQALDEYGKIKNAAQRAVRDGEADDPRLLMGQEMGTAAPITTNLPNAVLRKLTDGDCAGVESGHFGLYYVADLIEDSVYDCNESGYLRKAASGRAWGAVNHPDNDDGGSRWFCWNRGDKPPLDHLPVADDNRDGPECETGVAEEPATARAVEIINAANMPTIQALAAVDALLLQGQRIALVGGGDAHSVKTEDAKKLEKWFRKEPVKAGGFPTGFIAPAGHIKGNAGKIGLVGRTYVRSGPLASPERFETDAADDPVRRAISGQHTIASTGPLALPSIGKSLPGDTAVFEGNSVEVRVDLRAAMGVNGGEDGDVASDPGQEQQTEIIPAEVRRIEVVSGQRGSCPATPRSASSGCVGANTKVRLFCVEPDDDRRCDDVLSIRDEGDAPYAVLRVPVSKDIADGYVRTEALFGRSEPDGDFKYGDRYDHGAFSSPIWIQRDPAELRDQRPKPEDCDRARASRPDTPFVPAYAYCVTITTANLDADNKPDRLLVYHLVDRIVARVFLTTRGRGPLDVSFSDEEIPIGVSLPGFLYSVRDLDGRPGDEALILKATGAHNRIFAVLTVDAEEGPVLVRRRHDNELLDLIIGGGGSESNSFGCATSAGQRVLVPGSVFHSATDETAAYSHHNEVYAWDGPRVRLIGERTFTGTPRPNSLSTLLSAADSDGCLSPRPPDIGPVRLGATTPQAAVQGLLSAAADRDKHAAAPFINWGTSADIWGISEDLVAGRKNAASAPTICIPSLRTRSQRRCTIPRLAGFVVVRSSLTGARRQPDDAPVSGWTVRDVTHLAARACARYLDFYAVRAYGRATCARVRGAQRALYDEGFNAASEFDQFVNVAGETWRCTWGTSSKAPAVQCEAFGGRDVFRALLSFG